ncbi:MAG: type II toxin-antitoxin system VapC family toxin [Devosia sp.]
MRVLLDTHILLWAANAPHRLPSLVRQRILDEGSERLFSTASIWEVAIKYSQRRSDFSVEPVGFRAGLVAAGYTELPILSSHVLAVADLPWIHRDPFDRVLVAQAIVEDAELLTVDAQLGRYPAPVRVF